MKRNDGNKKNEVRVELKFCEHCGSLWVRECGGGVVYCENCQPKVADLPVPKKRPGRLRLPVGPRTLVEDMAEETEREIGDGETGLEAVGGVA